MSDLFYQNRRLLILVLALIVVGGATSYTVLPRMEDPPMIQRAALVVTYLPGARAERVETLVTDVLEEELQEIEEIQEVRSTSRANVSTLFVELKDEVIQADEVWSRVRDRLNDAAPRLPPAAAPPQFDELDVRAYALIVAVRWDLPSPPSYSILRRTAENLEDRLRGVAGTERIDMFGAPEEEIQVDIHPAEAARLGLSAGEIARQVQASDAKVAAGAARGAENALVVEIDSELESLARIRELPIQYDGEAFVQLSQVASVARGVSDPPESLSLIQGRPAVTLGILVEPNQRLGLWAARTDEALADYESQLPRGVTLDRVFEQNTYVQQRLTDLLANLAIGALAVALVIFVLMGWRSALIVGAALPLAALMVVAGMRFLHIPMHQMSVTGLIIALGLLIDNAIVIVDEVQHALSEGKTPGEAVRDAVGRMALPLFGSTLTTALAFAPIALMEGPAGEFVGTMSVTVVLAIFSSLALSLTITPALTAIGLGPQSTEAAPPPDGLAWWERGLELPGLSAAYRDVLDFALHRPWLTLAVAGLGPALGFVASNFLTEQFFPPSDRDQFQIELELPPQASLEQTRELALAIRGAVHEHDEVTRVDWFLGESAPSFYYNVIANRKGTPFFGQALVKVEGGHSPRDLIRTLQKELDRRYPRARILVRQLEQGPPFEAPIEARLFGPDLERLRALGEQLQGILARCAHVTHASSDLLETRAQIDLRVDEEQALLAGLTHQTLARQLDRDLEGAVGGSLLEETEEMPVRVRIVSDRRQDTESIASLDVVSPGTADAVVTPLAALAEPVLSARRATILRRDGRRTNEVQGHLTAGVLPAEVLVEFRQKVAAEFELPPGYDLEYGGEAAERNEAVSRLMANVAVLATLMIATLVLSFQSFRAAGIISVVGVAAIGIGLGVLWLFGYPFGFMAIIGSMGLVGVAINDSIVVLAALLDHPTAREGDPRVVREVVVRATRHVVGTTLTTFAGFLPLIVSGGAFWPPLAVAIGGGVAGATVLALGFVPASFLLFLTNRAPEPEVAV